MTDQRRRSEDSGPTLRYTNERAREMERNVSGFARLVNDDLYDLLKWAAELGQDRDRYREALWQIIGEECSPQASAIAQAALKEASGEDGAFVDSPLPVGASDDSTPRGQSA